MFTGFTKQAGEFMWELAFNNERPWFMEHKAQFEALVNTPMKALAAETAELMRKRCPERELTMHVSRIYRDARRLFGRGPYKDHLWFMIYDETVKNAGPVFWFEFGKGEYGYGMGFYDATSAQMEAFRKMVDANPARFERLAEEIEQSEFTVHGEEYKRKKAERGGVIGKWYNRKRIYVSFYRDFDGTGLEEDFPQRLCDAFMRLMPMYDYFTEFYQAAPPAERKR